MQPSTESAKTPWVLRFPEGEPSAVVLGRLVDEDHDEAETAYYEVASDPTYVSIETAQRRYRGMHRRRLRHLNWMRRPGKNE